MTLLTLHDRDGLALQAPCIGAEAEALLWQLGLRSGRWALQTQPVSATPLLTYARERCSCSVSSAACSPTACACCVVLTAVCVATRVNTTAWPGPSCRCSTPTKNPKCACC